MVFVVFYSASSASEAFFEAKQLAFSVRKLKLESHQMLKNMLRKLGEEEGLERRIRTETAGAGPQNRRISSRFEAVSRRRSRVVSGWWSR